MFADLALLFSSALLAATIFPAQSELLLIAFLGKYHDQHLLLFLSATIGNILGACINWIIGVYFFYLSKNNLKMLKYKKILVKYGTPSLLFSWLPIIGDSLTLLAGYYKINFLLFLSLVALGKAARYFILIKIFN